MNLEGKQQIWNDYQKEIADDRYYYARSCIRQTFFPASLLNFAISGALKYSGKRTKSLL